MVNVEVVCDSCGKIIKRVASQIERSKHHFCNRKCYGEWFKRKQKREVRCDNCGNDIRRRPSEVKRNKHHFCNRKCEGQWRSTDKEWREHLKKMRSGIRSPTKPELIFEAICKKHNLPFRYVGDGSLWIGKKGGRQVNPDFVECNSKKIAISINGDYWHSGLLKYDLGHTQRPENQIRICKRHKWKAVIIWESDLLREDAEQFVLHTLREEGVIK